MKTLAPVADKLGQFIRLLTSNRDGEVVAAARAIVRTLEGAGADIHDLAESVGATPNGKKFTEADAREIYERGVAASRRAAEQAQPATFRNVDDNDGPPWRACAAHRDRMRDQREKDFVADMVRWTHGGQPTEKQAKWLRSIYVQVRR